MQGPDLGTLHEFHGVQPVLPVTDVQRSVQFYVDTLGFELDFVYGDGPDHARVMKGDRTYGDPVYIHLSRAEQLPVTPCGETRIHVGKDIAGLHVAYERSGVEIVAKLARMPWNLDEFAMRDPDGHILRFCGYPD